MQVARFTVAYWCVLVAALLPIACGWLARQPSDWQARASAAQANSFEALPFFIGAVVIAHQLGAPQTRVDILAVLFITLRIIYIAMHVAGLPTVRTAIWTLALLVNVGILFCGWR
ncbi:MAG: glutathione metabolism protein [Ramlibacter sp.]|nr:glutathione metabolism protein [Ramlibacter sp.]